MPKFANLFAAAVFVSSFAAAPSSASVIIDITDGLNSLSVIVSGTLDLSGATFNHSQPYSTGVIPGGINWYIASGNTPGIDWYDLTGVTLPFGTSVAFTTPTSTSGDAFSIWGFNGMGPLVGVETGYASGGVISSDMVFADETIAGLSLIPGTYTFTLPSDTVTLVIGSTPEPGALALAGLGLAILVLLRRYHRCFAAGL